MLKLRFAIVGAGAALAFGTASAVAMQQSPGATDPDSHGATVAAAAKTTCPDGSEGVHGACVSAIASAEGQENQDGAQSANVAACKAKDVAEDKSETKPAKGDKAAKAKDHTEDKAEHKAFAACVSGKTAAA
jgi:hypothetical protein